MKSSRYSRLVMIATLPKRALVKNGLNLHMREVVRGASIVFALKMVGAGLGFGFNLLLARMLGAEGTGIYFLALTTITVATVFGRVGLDITLLRFAAAGAAVEDWATVKGVYRKGMTIAFVCSSCAALAVFAAAPLLAGAVFSEPELTVPMRWMALAIVPFALLTLQSQILLGLKRMLYSQLVQGIGIPAFSLLGLYLLAQTWGVVGAVWAYSLGAVLTMLLGFWLWRAATPQLRGKPGRFEARRLLRSSMPLFWVASMNLVMMWTATFMLGIWGTVADVGIFGVASRTVLLMSFLLTAVNSIAAPKFAALYQQGDMEALGSTARGSAKLLILLSIPVLLLLTLFPGEVLKLFGPQFVEGATALAVLAVGSFVSIVTGLVGYLLVMSGNERLLRNNVTVAALLNVALNLALIPSTGMLGAAIATAVSLAVLNLISVYLVWSRLRIWTIPFFGGGQV